MRLLFITLILTVGHLFAQENFMYGGYRVGSYIIPEAVPSIFATRFNEGYTFVRNDDDGMIGFAPTADPAIVKDKMQWGYLQNGVVVGSYIQEAGQGVEFGFHQFNQSAYGKRIHPVLGEEQFRLAARSGGIYMNVMIFQSRWFKPYVGFEAGTYRLKYWYSSSQGTDINHQTMGYRQNIWQNLGSNEGEQISGVGDRPIYLAMNLGFHLQLVHFNGFSFDIVTQYQGRWNRIEDISMAGKGPDLIFRHGNASVSTLFTYEIPSAE